MSVPGHDAIGHWAVGHPPDNGSQTFSLAAGIGSLSLAPQGLSFSIFENAPYTVLSLSPINLASEIFETAPGGSLALGPVALSFKVGEAAPYGGLTGSGQPATFALYMTAPGGALSLTPIDIGMARTGYNYQPVQGGVGHLLMEIQDAKRLAAITKRVIPPPLDMRTPLRFAPQPRPQSAPTPAPVDVPGILNQRMDAQMQAAQAAKKQQQDIEAILLLAA